jgi:hypothetical protein
MANRASRGMSFLGGVLTVATLTYIGYHRLQGVETDVTGKLRKIVEERQKVWDQLNKYRPKNGNLQDEAKAVDERRGKAMLKLFQDGKPLQWAGHLSVRMKKMWNEDIEKSVRRVQTTDWKRIAENMMVQMERAGKRVWNVIPLLGGGKENKST